jgi:hypothetical protein
MTAPHSLKYFYPCRVVFCRVLPVSVSRALDKLEGTAWVQSPSGRGREFCPPQTPEIPNGGRLLFCDPRVGGGVRTVRPEGLKKFYFFNISAPPLEIPLLPLKDA